MAGGFAVIKDVPKTLVFKLCGWLNERDTYDQYMPEDIPRKIEVIPRAIIDKPPSAEIRPDQKDSDTLPEYDVLDQIIHRYVNLDQSPMEIWAEMQPGESEANGSGLVLSVCRAIDRNEYKRRQAPPGIRISAKAFGRDRRLPISNRFA